MSSVFKFICLSGMVLCCIAAASASEVAVMYLGDSIAVQAGTFMSVLSLSHCALALLILKILRRTNPTR
jgi:hypothetical protein